jgi:PAS domain S-box-containing protein
MNEYNKKLQEVIGKYIGGEVPAELRELLDAVNDDYNRYETKIKIAVNAIAENTKKFADSYGKLAEVFFSVDILKNQYVWITATCEKVYGYGVIDFINNPDLWFDVVLDDDRQIILDNMPVLRKGKAIVLEYRIYHKDGSIRWLESKLEPKMNDKGIMVWLDGINSDITQRKEAEIALKESEYKFRSLIKNSSDAITITNEKFEVTFASDSLERITGFTAEDVKGKTYADFVHPDDADRAKAFFDSLLKTPGDPKMIIYRVMRKSGTYYWCERVSVNLLHNPAIKGIISNYRNITDRKLVEDQLQTSYENLKKTNMELDRFVYSVSHDLRAPLSSMLGVVGLMEAKTVDKELQHDLYLIKKSVQKLDGFILDILDYSKNSRLEINKEEVNFKKVLQETINNLKFMDVAPSHIDMRIQVDQRGTFYSDTNRIGVIFNNLISNAIRYKNPETKSPFVEITVHASEREAIITVEDNGIGISEEYHAKVFEMFSRLSKQSVGSGLGLYIVKETVQKMEGSVSLESVPGKGSVFTITLPNLAIS